jgi:hypothetical protein
MECTADQVEMFDFPVIDGNVAKRSVLRQFIEATIKHGPLVRQSMAAVALDLHRSRIGQLVDAGRIATVTVGGERYIPASAVELFLTEERKTGRPLKRATVGALFVAGLKK